MLVILKRETTAKAESESAGINIYEAGNFVVPEMTDDPIVDDSPDEDQEEDPVSVVTRALTSRDVTSSSVGTLSEGASVAEAWEFIQSDSVRHVLIVSPAGTIHGVISDRELLPDAVADATSPEARPLSERRVRDLVSSQTPHRGS